MGLVGSVRKDYISVKIMLGGIASTFLIGYVVSLFVPVNFAWISIGLVGAASIYLFYLSIRNWVWHYACLLYTSSMPCFGASYLGFSLQSREADSFLWGDDLSVGGALL